jgi:hypothetical protein
VNTSIIPNSRDGFFLRSTCFNNNALDNANITPIPADAKNMRQNLLKPVISVSEDVIVGLLDSRIEVVSTIATASFKMLSPNTSMLSTGSTFMA